MASIYQQKGKRVWYLAFKDRNGIWRKKCCRTADRKEAEALCRQASLLEQAARVNGTALKAVLDAFRADAPENLLPPRLATVKAAVDAYMEERAMELAASTAVRYRQVLGEMAKHLGADKPIKGVTRAAVVKFTNDYGERLKKASLVNRHKIIRTFWKWAVETKRVPEDPSPRLKKRKAEQPSRKAIFTGDQVEAVLAAAPPQWKMATLLGWYVGLAIGDAVTLKWESVDLSAGTLALHRIKTAEPVDVPLHPHLKAAIEAWRQHPECGDKELMPDLAASYRKYGTSSLSGQFIRLLEAAGIREKKAHTKTAEGRGGRRQTGDLSYHSFRHTWISNMRQKGAPSAVTEALAGHSNSEVHRGYTRIGIEALTKAISLLPPINQHQDEKA